MAWIIIDYLKGSSKGSSLTAGQKLSKHRTEGSLRLSSSIIFLSIDVVLRCAEAAP
jgi:hypothetical protein